MIKIPPLSPEPDVIKCRHCGSTQVRPSYKSSGDSSRVTYRCQSCKRHFRIDTGLPRTKIVSVGVALLVAGLIGVVASKFIGGPTEAESPPSVKLINGVSLAQTQQSAQQGNLQAQYDLGWTYWKNAEYQKAFPWIQAAASHGHIEAEYLLGMAYLNGRGTVQNYRSALEQFTKAAQKRHLEAQYRLGIFYRDGLATLPNKELAYLWLNIAAARGHEEALQYRDKLTPAMTTEEITRAQEASTQAIARLDGVTAGKP
jgi:hypothetical protein